MDSVCIYIHTHTSWLLRVVYNMNTPQVSPLSGSKPAAFNQLMCWEGKKCDFWEINSSNIYKKMATAASCSIFTFTLVSVLRDSKQHPLTFLTSPLCFIKLLTLFLLLFSLYFLSWRNGILPLVFPPPCSLVSLSPLRALPYANRHLKEAMLGGNEKRAFGSGSLTQTHIQTHNGNMHTFGCRFESGGVFNLSYPSRLKPELVKMCPPRAWLLK